MVGDRKADYWDKIKNIVPFRQIDNQEQKNHFEQYEVEDKQLNRNGSINGVGIYLPHNIWFMTNQDANFHK